MNCSKEDMRKLPFLTRFFRAVAKEMVIPKSGNSKVICKEEHKCDTNDC